MKIVSTNGSTIMNDGGVEYVAENGAFEVPQELGERLVNGPAFERDYIAQDKATAAEKVAAESRDGILSRIEALEAAVFPDRAPTSVPEPTPAPEPVPTAPEAPVTPEPVVVEPAPESAVVDVPVQSDASPVDEPPIAEPDAPVVIPPVETPVESEPVEALVEVPEDSVPVDPAAE